MLTVALSLSRVCSWFFGLISFQDANTLLARQPAGSFLFRWGSWQLSSLVACIAMPDHSIQQAKITVRLTSERASERARASCNVPCTHTC